MTQINDMVMEHVIGKMELFLKVIGNMIKLKEKEHILIQMEAYMKEISKIMSKMAKEKKRCMMERNT